MTNRYQNLDDIDLLEDRANTDYQVSEYVESRIEQVDEVFEDSDITPTLYPAEDTLHYVLTEGDVPEDEDIIFALAGDFTQFVGELDPGDFDEYHGSYITPQNADDTVLKVDAPETEAIPADVDVDNIEVKVPIDRSHNPAGRQEILPEDLTHNSHSFF